MEQLTTQSHLIALITTAAAAVILVPVTRFRPGAWVTPASWLLAAFLVGIEVAYQIVQAYDGTWSAAISLPLYVCDVAAFVAAAALIWPMPVLTEVTWFWGFGGAVQGLLTPDHVISFPSFDWLVFYGNHIGLVVTALFLIVGRRLHPRLGAALRVIVITVLFLVAVAVVDAFTGGNYDYLRTPAPSSLMSVFGPWPWYILGTTGVGIVVIGLLDLPFWVERVVRRPLQSPRD